MITNADLHPQASTRGANGPVHIGANALSAASTARADVGKFPIVRKCFAEVPPAPARMCGPASADPITNHKSQITNHKSQIFSPLSARVAAATPHLPHDRR
jgi:hypothetical protein